MKKQDLIAYFGSPKEAACALGVTVQALYQWDDDAIPIGRAYQAQVISEGKLQVERREQDARAEAS